MELSQLTAWEAGTLIRSGKLSCPELTKHCLDKISRLEPELGAFILTLPEQALDQAGKVQARIDAGEALPVLAGVPLAVKDNICTKDIPTSCASRALAGFRPPYDATAVSRLKAAGLILLGKTNLDELAMGGSTETSCFGPTRNPWDTSRVPGGSSGGSAAAVSAGEALLALGSDTGGSIRQPSSFCGISGIRPTYGAVSRHGLMAYASSLDQIGPMARSIRDCAETLAIMGGQDPLDSTSAPLPAFDFSDSYKGEISGVRIGIPSCFFGARLDSEVGFVLQAAADKLQKMGARLVTVDLPLLDNALAAYFIISCAEASSNLARVDGIRYGHRSAKAGDLSQLYVQSRSEGFGMEVKRRILLGTFVLSAGNYETYYLKGLAARKRIQSSYAAALEKCHLLLCPAAPEAAYKLGEKIKDPFSMALGDIYTVSVALAGLPGVSVPCGFTKGGMPVGMQLAGPAFSEPELVRVAHAFQLRTDYHLRQPEVVFHAI